MLRYVYRNARNRVIGFLPLLKRNVFFNGPFDKQGPSLIILCTSISEIIQLRSGLGIHAMITHSLAIKGLLPSAGRPRSAGLLGTGCDGLSLRNCLVSNHHQITINVTQQPVVTLNEWR